MPEKDLVAMLKRLLRAKVLEAEKELAEWQGDKDGRKHAAFWASRLKEHQEVLRRVEEAFDGAFPRDE
jgi:hypothetical protein